MLFDIMPKTSRRDLYNFDEELNDLYRGYRSARLIAVVGPRRIGKTSLILTFLNEYSVPHVFIDCRRISSSMYGASFRSFAESFSNAINDFLNRNTSFVGKLLEVLKSVRGVEVNAPLAKIYLKWRRRERFDLISLLESLNTFAEREGVVIALVFDELQELTPLNIDFSKVLAYTYDHLRNIVVIVSGSQVGLLYDVVRIGEPESPLYGRVLMEVKVRRLSRSEAVDFLEKGFSETSVSVSKYVIEEAVDRLDGVIGWLTYFGWSYVNGVSDLEAIVEAASRQEAEEVRRFLAKTRAEKRYSTILKLLAQKPMKWSEIKRALEFIEGIEIDDHNFNNLLQRLVKANFIEKRNDYYVIPDPILTTAVQRHI